MTDRVTFGAIDAHIKQKHTLRVKQYPDGRVQADIDDHHAQGPTLEIALSRLDEYLASLGIRSALTAAKSCLFIGGPFDGCCFVIYHNQEKVRLPVRHEISMRPTNPVRGTHSTTYFMQRFPTMNGEITVYAHESLRLDDMIHALIDNYPRREIPR